MRRIFTEEEKNIIYKEYVENKRGLIFISKQINSTPETIKKFLKNNNIHIRTFSEAAVQSNKNRTLKKDNNYFKTENSNMAWILGFIASDGTIRKNRNTIKIGLAIKDKEILERIRKEINIENKVKEYTNTQGFECCQLEWTSEEHKKDLSNYNIIPQKTFKLLPPLKLKKEYWIDYIRGYFDGDGSVNTNGNNGIRFSICAANKKILEWIIDVFYKYGIPKVNIYKKIIGLNPLYYFEYSTNSTKKIYNILYSTNSNLYLKRKKNKFEELVNKFN